MNKFIADFIVLLRSKFIVVLISFLSGIILARTLGPKGNGVLASILVYPSLFMTLGSLGIRQSTVFLVGKGERLEKVFSSILVMLLFTATIGVVVCTWIYLNLSSGEYTTIMILLSVAIIPFSLFTTYTSGIFLGKQKISVFGKVQWVPSFFKLLGVVLFVWWYGWGVEGALIAPLVGSLFVVVYTIFQLKSVVKFEFDFDLGVTRKLFTLGITYAIALLIINLNYRLDIILLERLSSAEQIGIYTKGYAIVEYLWEIPMLLSTIVFAGSANAKNSLDYSLKVTKLLRISLLFVLVGSLFLFAASPIIIPFLYGQDFLESVDILRILLPGIFLLTFFKVLNMDLAGRGKPLISTIAMLPALALNCVLNLLWIPKYGASGAALASTLSYCLAAFVFLFQYSQITTIKISSILRYKMSDFEFVSVLISKVKSKAER